MGRDVRVKWKQKQKQHQTQSSARQENNERKLPTNMFHLKFTFFLGKSLEILLKLKKNGMSRKNEYQSRCMVLVYLLTPYVSTNNRK